MNTRSVLLAALALAVASAACQPAAQEAGLSGEDIAALNQAADAYQAAVMAGDWDAWAAFYTEDAVIMPPGQASVSSRDAIKAWGEAFPTIVEWTTDRVDVDGRGDLAYVRATFSMTVEVEGEAEPVSEQGKYLEIWRKQPDGSWLIAVDIYNSDEPLTGESSET
jgi:uncharacterized protein (TIGR02246 family)